MHSSRVSKVLVLVFMVVALTACSNTPQTNQQSMQSSKANEKTYPPDGLLGTTGVNPNLPTNPTYHTYSDDTKMIDGAVRQIHGVHEVAIVLNGPRAMVTIQVDPALPDRERIRIREDAQQAASNAVPRYRVSVKLGKIE